MKYTIAFTTVGMYIVAVGWYCYLVAVGEIQTVLMTWLLFLATVVAGFISYLRSPGERHWVKNVCNVADVLAVSAVVVFLLVYQAYSSIGVRPFDLACFVGWIAIIAWWLWSKDDMKANIAFNALLVVAYIPLIQYLATTTQHTEAYLTWGLVFSASMVGLYNSLREKDGLGVVYAFRSTASTAAVLLLMARVDGYVT